MPERGAKLEPRQNDSQGRATEIRVEGGVM